MIHTEAWFRSANLEQDVRELQERVRRARPLDVASAVELYRLEARMDPKLPILKSALLERLTALTDALLLNEETPFGSWVNAHAWQAGVEAARDEIADLIVSITTHGVHPDFQDRTVEEAVRLINFLGNRETAWLKLVRNRLPKGGRG